MSATAQDVRRRWGLVTPVQNHRLRRSIVKSVVWRVIGIALLGGLGYAVTGNVMETLVITISFNGIRTVLYVVHEEVWERWAPLAGYGRHP